MKRELPLRRPLERAAHRAHAAVGGAKDDADVVPAVVAEEHREDGRIAGFGAAPERGERGGDVGAGVRAKDARARLSRSIRISTISAGAAATVGAADVW